MTVAAVTALALAGPATVRAVELMGRANAQYQPQSDQNAYYFRVSNTGAWSILPGAITPGVALAGCDGSAAQTWTVHNGTLVNSRQCWQLPAA